MAASSSEDVVVLGRVKQHLEAQLHEMEQAGLRKRERVLCTPQGAHVQVAGTDKPVLNLCANNYLGLADDPRIIAAAHASLDRWGYGLASVRFICGTQQPHRELEQALSRFLGTEETILYTSCFDANGGLFETLLGPEDAVISDELNHASIIDGIRLCKARRYRYKNNNMDDLRARLVEAADARFRLIATDGVFSMDGYIANLPAICDLADEHDALVMVDDSHAVGFLGPHGRGTHEYHNVVDRIDILTGTLGKALGGASGGYTSGRRQIIDVLRQRSRPYLFSNTVAPIIVGASLEVLRILQSSDEQRAMLMENTRFFRGEMTARGIDVLPGEHPIVPIMFYDAPKAARAAELLLERGIYVIAFSYPVVPMGRARLRVQISAAHTRADLQTAIDAFESVRRLIG